MLDRLYGAVTKTRNALYEKGVFRSFSLGVPTVSVGNLTVGGTGKTPLVALVAEILDETGETVGVLSRGYGRENSRRRVLVSDGEKILVNARQAGDEPFELAQKLLGKAIIIADANRVAAGVWAREKFGITAFVLDDAFQHRRVKRDINLVTIDATNPFGNEKLLPSGILREPLDSLERADAIVVTRANLVRDLENLKAEIKRFNSICPIFVARNKVLNLVKMEDFSAKRSGEISDELRMTNDEKKPAANYQPLAVRRYFAFCALGNPRNFFEQLREENFNVAATEEFPDHHFYSQKDIAELEIKAGRANADVLLTTAKDAVKLKDLKFDLPCSVVESRMIFDDGDKFRDWLTAKIDASK